LFGGDGWQDRDSDRKREETDSEKEQDREGIVLVAAFAWW